MCSDLQARPNQPGSNKWGKGIFNAHDEYDKEVPDVIDTAEETESIDSNSKNSPKSAKCREEQAKTRLPNCRLVLNSHMFRMLLGCRRVWSVSAMEKASGKWAAQLQATNTTNMYLSEIDIALCSLRALTYVCARALTYLWLMDEVKLNIKTAGP